MAPPSAKANKRRKPAGLFKQKKGKKEDTQAKLLNHTDSKKPASRKILKPLLSFLTLETFTEARKVKVEKVRESLAMELEGSIFVDAKWIPKHVFKDLPFHPKTMLKDISSPMKPRKLKKPKVYYCTSQKSKGWIDWPPTNEKGTEKLLGNYLNDVADAVRRKLKFQESPEDLVYSSTFSESGIKTDETTERKPDLIVVPRCMQDSRDVEWKDIRSFVSLKIGTQTRNDELTQITEYARMCFSKQCDRRYVLGLGFLHNKLSAYVFDRSGVLASPYYNVEKYPEAFLHLAIGMLLLPKTQMGYDPSFFESENTRYIKAFEADYEIIDELYVDRSIRGRGTVCLKAERDGETFVIKDSWVDRTRAIKEIDMLQELKGAGIINVPTLITGDIVQISEPSRSSSKVRAVMKTRKDCTETIRKELIEDIKERKIDQSLIKDVEIRDQYRVVMQPCGQRLDNFDSLTEILSATFDIFESEYFRSLVISLILTLIYNSNRSVG